MSKKHRRHHAETAQGQIALRPGSHAIDGVTVDLPAEEGEEWVSYSLPPGNHIIDQVMVRVDLPADGFPPRVVEADETSEMKP